MLTQAQKEALAEQLKGGVQAYYQVTREEREAYPARVEELVVPTTQGDARVYVLSDGSSASDRPLVVNFHGGGFISGHNDRDILFCSRLVNKFGALVLDVDYKLAPAHPYPTAALECWDVVQWVWENRAALGYDPEKVILTGHSSGGNLVAGLCMRLGQSGLFTPCCALIDYAPLDLVTDPARKKASICDMPAGQAQKYNAKYIEPAKAAEPYASPLYAPDELLEKFPPTLVITAGEDRLCEEGEEFALKLARAGVSVTLRRFTESIHGFVLNRMCEWKQGTELILSFIGWHLQGL